ncbi:MAG: polysaccharide biosynthesis C-terminal domain-containing protein, partial [Clostridia bacterium]|nr:polysaccharide biosynthesis C-terminal domain-containing protein [Clostridia bacterium]
PASANPAPTLLILLLIVFSMRSAGITSRYFGKKDFASLKRVMGSALTIGIVFTLILSAVCIGLCRPFLKLLNTQESLIGGADVYLKIVFAGAIFTYLYNFYCFSVRSIGDSYTPLIFLFASVLFNAFLDVLFVVVFKWGIEGTALATVAAQALSSVLCIVYTNKKFELLRLSFKDLKVDGRIVWEITSYSLSMSLQQVFVYVARIAIQGLVNTYPENIVAGANSGARLDALLQTPMRGYTNALTTYCAQNYGAKEYKRVVDGYKASWVAVAVVGTLTTLVTVLGGRAMVSLFDENPEVVSAGTAYLVDIGWGYMLMCVIVQSQAVFKGIGMLKTFLVSTLTSIIFRIAFSYLFEYYWGLEGMFWAPTASWVVGGTYCLVCMLIAYRKILVPLASGGKEEAIRRKR